MALTIALACGGKTEHGGDAPTVPTPTVPTTTLTPAATAPPRVECPELQLNLSFDPDVLKQNDIALELVQQPAFTEETAGSFDTPPAAPEDWDRSPVPEGACVFRLKGATTQCYAHAGSSIAMGRTCGESNSEPPPVPVSYYESHPCDGIAPGCSGPEWLYHRGWVGWYMTEQGDDTLLVLCAPQCHDVLGGTDTGGGASCLTLSPTPAPLRTCR
jgi:hypothetical protein